jgi:hypothetical protein
MCFSITARIAWSGQRTKALYIALLAKGCAVLVGWWVGILACRNVNNDYSLRFLPVPKSIDLSFWFCQLYQFFRWVFSCTSLKLGGSFDVEVAA